MYQVLLLKFRRHLCKGSILVCLTSSERFLFMRNGFKFLTHVESKTSRFEIMVKLLARITKNSQYEVQKSSKLLLAIKVLAIKVKTTWP